MMATASDMVWLCGVITVARLPSRWMWMRSATSNMCGMLWLIRMTGEAPLADVADQLQHLVALLDAECGRRLLEDDDLAAERC